MSCFVIESSNDVPRNIFDESIYTDGSLFSNLTSPVTVFHPSDEWLLNRLGVQTTYEKTMYGINPPYEVYNFNIYTMDNYKGLTFTTVQYNQAQVVIEPSTDVISYKDPSTESIYGAVEEGMTHFDIKNMFNYYTANSEIYITEELMQQLLVYIPANRFRFNFAKDLVVQTKHGYLCSNSNLMTLTGQTPLNITTDPIEF